MGAGPRVENIIVKDSQWKHLQSLPIWAAHRALMADVRQTLCVISAWPRPLRGLFRLSDDSGACPSAPSSVFTPPAPCQSFCTVARHGPDCPGTLRYSSRSTRAANAKSVGSISCPMLLSLLALAWFQLPTRHLNIGRVMGRQLAGQKLAMSCN